MSNAASLFGNNWLSWQIISDDKIHLWLLSCISSLLPQVLSTSLVLPSFSFITTWATWLLILRLVYLKGRSLQEFLDSWRCHAKLCLHPCCQRSCNILPPPLFAFTLVNSELEPITNTVSGCVNVMIWCLSIVKYCPKCVKVYHKHCGCPLIGALLTLLSFQFQLESPTPTCDGITGGSVQQQQQRRWPAGGQVVQQHSSQVAFPSCTAALVVPGGFSAGGRVSSLLYTQPPSLVHPQSCALFSMQTFTRSWSTSWVQQLCTRKLA